MKVVNRLDNSELKPDQILSVYTGQAFGLADDSAYETDRFEASVPDRIMPRELVLHELNLLQIGFTFWVKIDTATGGGAKWVPARIDA
ncbi:MAG: hypothetical protein LJE94_04420 [Deltaproteobacteria bacterium]|jgi:hypothetical protein|nr:hypothetical protein [Deltaproteobacteria bacterium]